MSLLIRNFFLGLSILLAATGFSAAQDPEPSSQSSAGLSIRWKDHYLTISGPQLPGGELKVNYLEAYCRPGSTNRIWHDSVIQHRAELVHASDDHRVIQLRNWLDDGVIVDHTITASNDEIDFLVIAKNPTDKASEATWAQPCMRVQQFTNTDGKDALALVPTYARKCFLFIDGKLTRLPTTPWAEKARYVPGQIYCARNVDPNDLGPRPLSELTPSNGLIGCFSGDEKYLMAAAWEPYQELFQGIASCIHSDFRIGGLKPGETKQIRGKIYIMAADTDALIKRYEKDFPEHLQ